MSRLAKTGSLILHIDATAGIIRRAEYVKRQLYLFSAVVDCPYEDTSCVSISDCLMEECRSENAEFWLRRLRNDASRMQHIHLNHEQSAPAVVVVDFSWVLLHACASVFCGTTIVGYLNRTFAHNTGSAQCNDSVCSLFVCSSHFMAVAARNLRRHFSAQEKEVRELLLHCIGGLISAPTLNDASLLWDLMIEVFGRADCGSGWEHSFERLLHILEYVPQEIRKFSRTEESSEVSNDDAVVESCGKASIRSMSPYFAFFRKPPSESDSSTNPYFKPTVLSHIHNVWLPLYGLWDQPSIIGGNRIRHYLTNAKVECWFR